MEAYVGESSLRRGCVGSCTQGSTHKTGKLPEPITEDGVEPSRHEIGEDWGRAVNPAQCGDGDGDGLTGMNSSEIMVFGAAASE